MFNFFLGNSHEVSIDDVKQAQQDKSIAIIDVRMPDEYKEGHLKGSTLIPLPELEHRLSEIPDKSQKLFLYCRSGGRSGRAAAILRQLGYTNAFSMSGGILAWESKNYPIEK